MSATPLGTLLSDTIGFASKNWKPVVIGALVFGSLMTGIQVNLRHSVVNSVGTAMEGLGTNAGRLKEIMDKAGQGDQEAAAEMARQMQELGGEADDLLQQQALGAMMGMFPSLGKSMVLSIIITLLSVTYFFIVALRPSQSLSSTIGVIPGLLLPMLGLWLWTFIRSFVWVPIIGIIPAIIYYPRFIAAPIYLIEQKKSVFDSVTMSMAATRFYWGKIVGNMIVFGICCFVITLVVGMVLSMAFGSMSLLATWGSAVVGQVLAGVGTAFAVMLAQSLIKNPVRV